MIDKTNGTKQRQAFDWSNPNHVISALNQVANDDVAAASALDCKAPDIAAALQQLLRAQVFQLRCQASVLQQIENQREAQRRAASGVVGARFIPPNGGLR